MPSRLVRVVLYGVLVLYGLVASGSIASRIGPGQALRDGLTRPFEKTLGIYQTWPMFRVAPRQTQWLTLRGTRRDGSTVDLDVLPGRSDPHGTRLTYDRLGKLQRNAASERREKLRMGIVRWVCRTEEAAGRPLRTLTFTRHRADTPPPGSGRVLREQFDVRTRPFKRWNCR